MKVLILAALVIALAVVLSGCASQMAEPSYYHPDYYAPRPDYGWPPMPRPRPFFNPHFDPHPHRWR